MSRKRAKWGASLELISLFEDVGSFANVAEIAGCSRQLVHQVVTGYHNTGHRGREHLYAAALDHCQSCGKPADELHHRDANNANDLPENLEPLCVSCHKEIHKALRLMNGGGYRVLGAGDYFCERCAVDVHVKFKVDDLCRNCRAIKWDHDHAIPVFHHPVDIDSDEQNVRQP